MVAQASDQLSSNWAGYVATARHGPSKFSSVSGAWVVPAASCTGGHEAYSAVWVGVGGFRENAEGLEQLGTGAELQPQWQRQLHRVGGGRVGWRRRLHGVAA